MLQFTRRVAAVAFIAHNPPSFCRCYAAGNALSKPLSIFVCAADEASDSAGAALVASLKQTFRPGVQLYGVGGPLLQAQGLHSVVSDEQYQHLATAEVVQQAYGLHRLQGISPASKTEYLNIFRNVVWEAVLHGCSGRDKAHTDTQQAGKQQQTAGKTVQFGTAQLPANLVYDAVLTVCSPTASHQVLFFLRKAEEAKKARLPVIVHYMVPGLWDYQQVSAAAAAWAKLSDHVMCGLPFEPQLLHAAGGPASFVGHPVVEPLLQQRSFSSRKAAVIELLQQRVAGPSSSSSSSSSSGDSNAMQQQQQQANPAGQLFTAGDPGAFWRVFDGVHRSQHASSNRSSGVAESSTRQLSDAAGSHGSSSSSSTLRKRNATDASPAATASGTPGQQHNRLLLCLLPGSTEAEVQSSMPAFDDITKTLLQQFPNLAAAMILPDLLVEAGVQATNNFSLPVVVLPTGSTLSTNALAAADAALSHPGTESLRAVAAGVPMVCVRDGSLVRDGFSSWRRSQVLPYGCIPNLVLGSKAVPEINLWARGGREAAVGAVAQLLQESEGRPATASSDGGSSSSSASTTWLEAQRAALQDVLLALVPQLQPPPPAAAGAPRVNVQAPSAAAAATLLELVALRKQQEAEQLQALVAASGQQ